MVRIQLETGYLDVKDGTNLPINFGIGDIRDISKKTGTFSKTITLDGTKNNHELLNHYYDTNVIAGTFNVNTLTTCTLCIARLTQRTKQNQVSGTCLTCTKVARRIK